MGEGGGAGLGERVGAPRGPGRRERVLKEDLRKILEGFDGKSREPKRVTKVLRVLEAWRKRRS